LRGSANVIKEVSAKEVSTTVSLEKLSPGEQVITLTPENVQAPFGTEVIRINPSQVRLNLEWTISKTIPVVPTIQGQPAAGFEMDTVLVNPSRVRVQGPESRLRNIESISTVPIPIDGKRSSLQEAAGLDLPDPQVRLLDPSKVEVRIDIRGKGRH
jgi:YbbR domain-containing protein